MRYQASSQCSSPRSLSDRRFTTQRRDREIVRARLSRRSASTIGGSGFSFDLVKSEAPRRAKTLSLTRHHPSGYLRRFAVFLLSLPPRSASGAGRNVHRAAGCFTWQHAKRNTKTRDSLASSKCWRRLTCHAVRFDAFDRYENGAFRFAHDFAIRTDRLRLYGEKIGLLANRQRSQSVLLHRERREVRLHDDQQNLREVLL